MQASDGNASSPAIRVIYPREGQVVSAVDSTFILGNITPANRADRWQILVNGHPFPVHEGGGFLAFVPIEPGKFVFRLAARAVGDDGTRQSRQKSTAASQGLPAPAPCSVAVMVPEPLRSYSRDSLKLGPEYNPPAGAVAVSTGDRIEAWVQGTPGCRAWFSVPGVVDSVPMGETDPRLQPYWGEAVFGIGAVPDSMRIAGIYSGFYEIPPGARSDSVRIQYHLAPPDPGGILAQLVLPPYDPPRDSLLIPLLRMDSRQVRHDSSLWRLTVNDPRYPFAVEFSDSVQIVRHGPRRGYLSIYQPRGVTAMVVGKFGEWYRMQLSRSQFGWVNQASVRALDAGLMPPRSYLRSIRSRSDAESVRIEFPLAGKHPFRVIEEGRRTLRLQLYGVTTDTDWIRYDAKDSLIDLMSWGQPEEGLYEFRIDLRKDIWGYDTYYTGSTLTLMIERAPDHVGSLKGKTIIVDPGHSRDPGSVGPTGYTEAEANLGIALALRENLEHAGARVVMTRADTSHVELNDRPAIAKQAGAELFVSIHNNALPDGVNPFVNNGTSSYYYHPHSLNFARSIHRRMTGRLELPDHGLYHGNLAVLRPTQYPAVLVECTFMLLPDQEAALKTSEFRKKVARAITEGIKDFLEEYDDANR